MDPKFVPTRGRVFTLTMKALALARGDAYGAAAWAEAQNFSPYIRDDVVSSLKSLVSPEGTSTTLRPPSPAEFDFAEFIRPLTIIGRLIGLRKAASRVRQIAAVSGSSAYWSGEGNWRPVSQMDFTGQTINELGVTSILVSTLELIRSSDPAAESIFSRDLATGITQAVDQAFIDPANLGIANVMPAAITADATAIHSSGSSLAEIDSDLSLLIEALADSGSTLEYATFILRPRTALYLSLLRGSGGALAHPQLTVKGGYLAGLPAIVSASVPSEIGSPILGRSITLVDPSQILVCDSGQSALEISEETALQMSNAPGSGATSLVSLWQNSSVALKLTRYLNWQAVRPGMAQVLDQVNY
ncbi:MAG: phage major capsid protein [Gallionellaceae bacterium]